MDEAQVQRIKIAVAVFCLTVLLYQFIFNFGDAFTWLKVILGFFVATVIAGVAFGVMTAIKKP